MADMLPAPRRLPRLLQDILRFLTKPCKAPEVLRWVGAELPLALGVRVTEVAVTVARDCAMVKTITRVKEGKTTRQVQRGQARTHARRKRARE